MKKITLFLAFLGVLALALGAAGFAYAQVQTAPGQGPFGGYGHGMMAGFEGHGRGMMGEIGEYGPMHESMLAALAEKLGITVEEIETRMDAGESMIDIAGNEGLDLEEIQELMLSIHNTEMDEAVADGSLTQEQVDWMNTRHSQMWDGSGDYGPGSGHCEHWSEQTP